MALHAKNLRAAGGGAHGRSGRNKVPLLPQHEAHQSHADRAKRAAAGLALVAGLFCPPAGATSDPLTDALAPGGFGISYAIRFERAPYRGSVKDHDQQLFYLYEGERFYLHGSRVGLKLDYEGWRFDAFFKHRFEGFTQDRPPASAAGMALREPGIDAGVSLRRRTAWGTPYLELSHDVSNRSDGAELKLGYWNDWSRGRLTLRPHAALSLRDARLNDFYYGVRPAEATAQRPAYSAGGGVDAEIGLYAAYRLTDSWHLIGGLGALRRAGAVRLSPIVEGRVETALTLGVMYDFSPQAKRWAPEDKPLIVRALYGHSSDCDVLQIVRLSCTSTHTVDNTDIWGVDVGRYLIRRPYDWPVDIAGFVGVVRHLEKGFQQDFWQANAYAKVHYWGFPWDRWVRTRLGFGAGLSYAEHIPESELRDQAKRGRGTWKLLNYLDPTVDFRLGDVIPARALGDTYLGVGVSHRSGMFGKSRMLGDVNGGSNYIYGFVETMF